jgi:sulfoxide reductase catalytic subunit YedY
VNPVSRRYEADIPRHDVTPSGSTASPSSKQHGAPLCIVVSWKYGYRNPKANVGMELSRASTFWQIQPDGYGLLSTVNPFIPHPRWSQATSYWLGDEETFPTPIFNGYGTYVAELYPDEPRTLQEPLKPGQKAR